MFEKYTTRNYSNGDGTDLIQNCHEICLIAEFFKNEQKKPAHLRSNSCMISCPCRRCNPTSM